MHFVSIKKDHSHILFYFLGIIFLLLIIGIIFVYSASSAFALETLHDSQFFFKRHLFGIFLGLITLCITSIFPIILIKQYINLIFIASLFVTAATLFPTYGIKIHGSSRWLNIVGITFQPSEILKVFFIMIVAYYLSKKQIGSSQKKMYFLLIAICVSASFVLLKQPDFGLTVTLLSTAIVMLFVTSNHVQSIIGLIGSMIAFCVCLILAQPYRIQRITTFLNPWKDPKGKGFQIIQSFIAIGSGGWSGVGITHSKQKFFYLPMQHTDFIFSIIAEETGFLGSFIILTLFTGFIFCGLKIAQEMKDPFTSLYTLGFSALIGIQTIINIAVTTGLAPTKGIGLPFISYGNTSMLCTLSMIGFIINAKKNDRTW